MNLLRTLARSHKQKLAFFAGITTVALSLVIMVGLNTQKVQAADYSPNAIMTGGFSSPSDFISKVRANDDGHGHHDLQAIYNASPYSLGSGDYNNFVQHAQLGTAYKDGRIVVNGQTVANGTNSIGRQASAQGSNYYTQTIGGETFYGNSNSQAFASDGLPVYVLFDAQGTLKFAVLKDCGNPMGGTKVVSSASCNMLQKTAIADRPNTYNFRGFANLGGNAVVSKYIYNFGDGSALVPEPNGSGPVQHTYTKPGNWTATVTVFANLPGSPDTKLPIVAECSKSVTVINPFYQCLLLTSAMPDATNKYKYSFTTTSKYGNGAQFSKYTYNFGDGTNDSATGPITHLYTKPGTYTVKASVVVIVNGAPASATSTTCQKKVTVVNPFGSCVQLNRGDAVDYATHTYSFVATATYGNGATLVSADFAYGDGATQNGVKSKDGKTFMVTHTYAAAGTYDASAAINFLENNKPVTAPLCKAVVTPTQPPTPECKPGIPVGDVRCSPCTDTGTTPSGDTNNAGLCAPAATVLPNTGAGNVIAIFGVVVVGSFLIYRQLLFRRHKAAFVAAEQGTSALPLGQPLDPSAPLAGTPLAAKRRSLRRRQF